MKRVLSLASHELFSHLSRRSFRIAVIALPILFSISLMVAAGILWSTNSLTRTVGYISKNSVVRSLSFPSDAPVLKNRIQLLPLGTKDSAIAALRGHLINSFMIFPEDFDEEHPIEIVSLDPPDTWTINRIKESILIQTFPHINRYRLRRIYSDVFHHVRENSPAENPNPEEVHDNQLKLICGVSIFLSLMLIFGGATRLAYGFSEERNTHSMELLLSSVSPIETAFGKVLGQAGLLFLHCLTNSLILVGVGLVYASQIYKDSPPMFSASGLLLLLIFLGVFLLSLTHYLAISAFTMMFASRCKTYRHCAELAGAIIVFVLFTCGMCFKVYSLVRDFSALFLLFPFTSGPALFCLLIKHGSSSAEFSLGLTAIFSMIFCFLCLTAHRLSGQRAFDWRRSRRRSKK